MNAISFDPRSLLHLLFHGSKAIEVVETARMLGILQAIEPGPVTLEQLARQIGAPQLRLYKFLDCLESLQLVAREQPSDDLGSARYRAVPGLRAAAELVLGPNAQEHDRDRTAWREIAGRMPEFLQGDASVPQNVFAWPPPADQAASFEASMRAGLGPFREAFFANRQRLFDGARSWLDVGGGDGTLGAWLLPSLPGLHVSVFNLPSVEPLVRTVAAQHGALERLGFVGGDFLAQPLPEGHDVISFVRVLHDWPAETARMLIGKAGAALRPGGRIVISEEFRTSERLATQFFWTWFLVGVDGCVSRLREASWYEQALASAGFTEIERLPGAQDIVTAVRGP